MRKSHLAAVTAICLALPLGAQEPQVAPPPSVLDNPLFHNPFASQPQPRELTKPVVTIRISPKAPVPAATACAVPLLNAAPKDAAHYSMPTVSPQKDLDPQAFIPSMTVCGSSQQNAASLLKK